MPLIRGGKFAYESHAFRFIRIRIRYYKALYSSFLSTPSLTPCPIFFMPSNQIVEFNRMCMKEKKEIKKGRAREREREREIDKDIERDV